MQDCRRAMSRAQQLSCIAAAALSLFVVGLVISLTVDWIAPTMYHNHNLFRPEASGPLVYFVIHPFLYGVVFGTIYLLLLRRGGLQPGIRDGLNYGLCVFLVGSLPVYMLNFASFMLPASVILCWIFQSACQYVAAGVAVGWVAQRFTDSR